ncbi:hypothetical protein PHYPSEUDO_009362 [Phytophthora pseudosyringae]|uniref:HAT C-terminal dimerisation domain-containing protein n=1 Tax=Phytophthora pseudosyringae TaxID=221518 RepID=A0A8T1WE18_9STRA|nr:hypothetical protein PHYPSEUDO_009362 [Phytophthora pseudosyringae]
MRGRAASDAQPEAPKSPDPLSGERTDRYGIPLSVTHAPQTDLPVWQFIQKLATPFPNPKRADRPYTHVCVLCSASPPLRYTGKQVYTWRSALMRQRMSTNAVAHMQRVHPDEFVTIANHKQRKREALVERAAANANVENQPRKKRAKKTPAPKRKTTATQEMKESKESEPSDAVPVTTVVKSQNAGTAARKRAVGKTAELLKTWLIASGLPVSMLQDKTFQHLLKLSNAAISGLPTAASLNTQVQDEFAKFSSFLGSYLAAEAQAAMGLPFLSLRHEFRPVSGAAADDAVMDDVVSSQEKAFLSVAVGFIDSQWRRVDLVLAAKEVPRGWGEQVNQLVTQTVSDTYSIHSMSNYARFHVNAENDSTSILVAGEEYEPSTDEHEDLLTHTLRRCVVEALGVGPDSSYGDETNVRRILRLLQELLRYFEGPDRAQGLAKVGATSLYSASAIDNLALSSLTSIGAIAELLRVSCSRHRSYSLYFQSPVRSTEPEPEVETAWMQLSMDDWQTATEIEAVLNQLMQFRLEERIAPRPGAVAPSYAVLFRRLLLVTTNASSLKCLSLEEDDAAVESSPMKHSARRKAKRIATFTPTGHQCILRLRQVLAQRFASPSAPSQVDDEIKAMLLDPRISSKAANLVTDNRAFRRAQEALRQEHRVVFELLAARSGDASPSVEDEDEDEDDEDEDEDEDEISSLLMVDGPKNQPPAAPSTKGTGKRSSDAVAVAEDEARAWREWQQVYVAWDTLANEGADLFDKGQYNLMKLYHHVDILKWFRDVGQQAHPAASLLARMYLGQQTPPSRALGASSLRFTRQEDAGWVSGATQRAEKRCILHHNWHQYQKLSANASLASASDENINTNGA